MATFTNTTKNPLAWEAPTDSGTASSDTFLLIATGFYLLINDTNKLVITPSSADTVWTTVLEKNQAVY